jgi:hypothetical protein
MRPGREPLSIGRRVFRGTHARLSYVRPHTSLLCCAKEGDLGDRECIGRPRCLAGFGVRVSLKSVFPHGCGCHEFRLDRSADLRRCGTTELP